MTEITDVDKSSENVENQTNIEVLQMIHDSTIALNQIEWQRTRDIESKATGIVGFVGVIFSLTIASLSTIISTADETVLEKILSPIYLHTYIIVLVLMTLSILFGVIALNVKNWEFIAIEDFVKFCKQEEVTKKEICNKIIDATTKTTSKNCEQNNKISDWLKLSYYLFMISVIVLLFYFVHLLYLFA